MHQDVAFEVLPDAKWHFEGSNISHNFNNIDRNQHCNPPQTSRTYRLELCVSAGTWQPVSRPTGEGGQMDDVVLGGMKEA